MHFEGSCAGKGNSDAPLESGHVVGFASMTIGCASPAVSSSGKAFSWVTRSLELATFATLRPTNYHLFIRLRKKTAPPVIKAKMMTR